PPAAGMPVVPQLPVDNSTAGGHALFGPLAHIAFDNDSTLYVADYVNNVVRTITVGGNNSVQTLAGTPAALGSNDGPGPAARFWNIGTMYTVGHVVYISDNGNATIRKYDFDSGMLSTIAGSAGLLGNRDDVGEKARF